MRTRYYNTLAVRFLTIYRVRFFVFTRRGRLLPGENTSFQAPIYNRRASHIYIYGHYARVLARVTQRARALFYTRGTHIVGDRIMYAAECLHTRYSGLGRTATAAYARTTQSSDVGELFSISRRRDFRTVPLLLTGRPVTVEPGGRFAENFKRLTGDVFTVWTTRRLHGRYIGDR